MLVYNKPSQYALCALSYIANAGPQAVCQAEVVAEKESIPRPFLAKLLKQMVQQKILRSIKGPGGGFILNKSPEQITLYDIVSVFENLDDDFSRCAIGWTKCSDTTPCALYFEHKRLRTGFKEHMKKTKLSVFIEARKQKDSGWSE